MNALQDFFVGTAGLAVSDECLGFDFVIPTKAAAGRRDLS